MLYPTERQASGQSHASPANQQREIEGVMHQTVAWRVGEKVIHHTGAWRLGPVSMHHTSLGSRTRKPGIGCLGVRPCTLRDVVKPRSR